MDWSNEDSLQLIEQYRLHTELWDRADPKYKDKMCRFRGWSEIADSFGCTKAEVERKMNVLLTQYRREKHKMLMKRYEGMQPGTSKWYAFKNFGFLENVTSQAGYLGSCGMMPKPRKRKNNLGGPSNDDNIFAGMRLSIPFLMANHNNHTWTSNQSASGLFQPSQKFKSMFPLPINTSNNDNMLLLQRPDLEHLDEKDTKENQIRNDDGTPLSPNCSPDNIKPDEHDSTSEIDIKPELTDFLHPASHRHLQTTTESNRSYSPSHGGDENIAENDDFAQDLRITSSRNLDCGSSYEHHPLLQGGSLDSKDSSPNFKRFTRFNSGLHAREEPDRDDCDYIGSNVTIKLRTMDKTQRIIAEKLISEVLFYGQFTELDKTAKVIPKES
ncbi:hypothetical protein ACFFRR_004761 [Megaselia abdita]